MESKKLYFLKYNSEVLLKKKAEYMCCLSEEDVRGFSLSLKKEKECGTVEVNDSVVYTIVTALIEPIDGLNEEKFEFIPEGKLFERNIHPADKLFLMQLVKGVKNINLVVKLKEDRIVTAYDKRKINPFVAFYKHLHTVNTHRRLVRRNCFKVGLYWQGIIHDLSKYSPSEFLVGVKYYQGMRSPNVAERMTEGYSRAWMHHKGRNRHHQEYWTDYSVETGNILEFMHMPRRYLVESIMDRIAACKVYRGKAYNDGAALDYLTTRDSETHMNKENYEEMVFIFTMLKEKGETETFKYIKEYYLKEETRSK